ncbi:hypothetical protein CC86DRAFT_448726 [Ophiobolus disseminans]|uniref:FAD-binding FR-type domain-containing protein n=1 Tax=Ophiobolus disseminans TaxID=1469910 RepID=A0A6A6ZND9_9PLEO|nr:hypothetical protein CC86DRAFT_448726 [Ophiobolus disseminans]
MASASTQPQMGFFIASVRHFFSLGFTRHSASRHSSSPHRGPRPYSTRLYHPQDRDSPRLEARKETKSMATSTTSSILVSTSPEERPLSSMQVETPNSLRRFCIHWFTAYRILIGLVIVINLLILGLLLGLYSNTGAALLATAANLLASIIVRQEDLINVSFRLVARIPFSLPLRLRVIIADLHHYGGVHIGCAISSLIWYTIFVAVNTTQYARDYKKGTMTSWQWADICTCYIVLLSIIAICITALPRLRSTFHNTFERTHRFAGWFALLVLWLNTGIQTHTSPSAPPLYASPALWLLAATTFLIILPWLRIRQVPITATHLSTREIKLTFPHKNMPHTCTSRFSLSPLTEWHAFATIPSPDGDTASIVISAAGDWTRSIVANPPTKLWIRAPPTANFLTFAPLFTRILLVATGAGIGPILSLLSTLPQSPNSPSSPQLVKILWLTPNPHAPHWSFALNAIRAIDAAPLLLDSKQGRRDIVFEAQYAAQAWDVEAVFVVGNKGVTDGVVRGVMGVGRKGFGAVFDS